MEEKHKLFEALDDVGSIFSEVNDEWAATCFEDNFSDFGSFAHVIRFSILQAFDYSLRLSELCSRLLLYAQKANSSVEIWHEMTGRNFDAKKLCVFAWYLIERGQQPDVCFDDQKIGLIGCRIYISLCCLSGAQAFNILNDCLFQKALEGLRLVLRLFNNGHLSTTNDRAEITDNTKSKNKKPFATNNSRTQRTEFQQLTFEDRTELRYMLCDVLDSLFVFLNRGLLSSIQQSLISLAVFLQQLMQLDFSESTSFSECKQLSGFQRLENLSDRSFALMHCFLNNRHSVPGVIYGRIVMPRLLFRTLENTKGSEEEIFIILLMLQNVCFRCPDRSDYRAKVANSVVKVLAHLSPKYIRDFAAFLLLIAANSKVAVRGFAVEIAVPFIKQHGRILEVNCKQENATYEQMDEKDISSREEISTELEEAEKDGTGRLHSCLLNKCKLYNNLVRNVGFHNAILVLLLRSCNDKSPMVRTRALMQIATLLSDENVCNKLLNLPKSLVYTSCNEDEDIQKHQDSPTVLRIIVTRCLDARVSTRKAAIIALESLFPRLSELQRIELLPVLQHHCRDLSLLVRKQAAESLSHLLSIFGKDSTVFDKAWLTSVLPLINDREQSVVQLASKLVYETVILPALEEAKPVAWRILETIEREVDHRRLLLRSLLHQAKEGGLSEHAVEILLKKCDDLKNVNIIWMLLNFLSSIFKVDESEVVRFWYTLNGSEESNLVSYVAEVIARCADRINETSRNQLIEDFRAKLLEFSVDESHIAHVYYAFARLCKGVGDEGTGAEQFLEFNRILMDKSLKILHSIIFRPIHGSSEVALSQEISDKTATLLVRIINSLGEVIQYSPVLLSVNSKVFDIMQLIMASDVIQQQLIQTGKSKIYTRILCFQFISLIHHVKRALNRYRFLAKQELQQTDVERCNICEHCAFTTGFLQCSKSSIQSNNNVEGNQKTPASTNYEYRASQPISHGLGPTFLGQHTVNMEVLSPAVRAQAVLAIGKMCLQDEKLAKKCVPVLSRQLLVNSNHLVRSNIVGVICDLCKRYTLLVDRHSAIIASCLKDPSTLVRKQTLMLLTHLIKEQYVRWAGQIMYRFVSTVLDENEEVRKYAELCLVDVLLVQFPSMFVNHFLECLFYFNSVTHKLWLATTNAMEEDAMERQELKCSLSGLRLKNARMRLYRFMIKTFNDENKFTIGMRIGQEVYSAIVEGLLDIFDSRVKALLEDCYEIMCCPEIKLSMALGKKSPNEADDDDDEPPSNVQEAARKVVTQAFRKGIVDAILPHIIQLKYYLQEKRLHELEFGIIRVLRELCKDHREQLDEFLASDKQLKAEIKFDLEKLEEKERRIKVPSSNDKMVKTSFLQNKRKVSFATESTAPSPHIKPRIPKEKCETEIAAETEVERSKRSDKGDFPLSAVNAMDGGEMVERGTSINNDGGKNAENLQPAANVNENFSRTAITVVMKRRSERMQFEQSDEQRELPMRAISTPEHNIGELTFGLGDEMSAIESTPTRKRSKRQVRQPCVPPIEEADSENE
ncbi:unnamed protein product [Litomosoides sigmodontis]|uniref:Condensin complex subunit 1 C-terminal domain-containing protein n=1 Tax=Litomosoides sigmodontis TaxID=42156 RepID=A0A3P6V5Z7_LITSI|nr:unnamed protein product [Litomosoides sigmodontis]